MDWIGKNWDEIKAADAYRIKEQQKLEKRNILLEKKSQD